MKKICSLVFVILLVASCAPSYQSYNRKQYKLQKKKNQSEELKNFGKKNYTIEMVQKYQSQDAAIISTWSDEEKKWFAEHFIYKDIFFRNDTLIVIK
jgi:hypothetical protein